MTPLKKWLITLGISAAIVVGFAAGLLMKQSPLGAAGLAAPPGKDKTVPELREREGQPFPAAELIGQDGRRLDDAALREGKVMLVLLTSSCPACKKEGEFLRTLVGKRQDVKFIGAMSFEQDDEAVKRAQTLFPFAVYRDKGMRLERELNLGRVPVKIYLENGIVKRSWDGASTDAASQQEFTRWLTELR
jgi:hypothetical protein